MSDAKKFKEWYGDRCGHPLGVNLGMKAVIELEQENAELRGLNAALKLAYDLEKLTDEELQIFKSENKETIEKLFKLLNK